MLIGLAIFGVFAVIAAAMLILIAVAVYYENLGRMKGFSAGYGLARSEHRQPARVVREHLFQGSN